MEFMSGRVGFIRVRWLSAGANSGPLRSELGRDALVRIIWAFSPTAVLDYGTPVRGSNRLCFFSLSLALFLSPPFRN